MARTEDAIERIRPCLFLNEDNMPYKLSDKDMKSKKRIEAAFAYALENPQEPDKSIVDHIKKVFGIEKSQAYWDINVMKSLLGNIKNAGKEWHRHVLIQTCLEALAIAKAKKNPIAMVMAVDKIGKYTNLDKEKVDPIDWEKVQGFDLEITSDHKAINPKDKKDYEAIRRKLMKEFLSDIDEADTDE